MSRKIKDYRLLESVGEDPLGSCYLASSADGKQMVWLTLGARRFDSAEAQLANDVMQPVLAVRSEYILSLLDVGFEEDGTPYLVHDFYNGASLHCLIEKNGPLSWNIACVIASRVCRALQVAHQQGVYHGSLNPKVVLLGEDGSVKLRGLGVQSMNDQASGEIMLSGGQVEQDIRQLLSLLQKMTGGLTKRIDEPLPNELEPLAQWRTSTPNAVGAMAELERLVADGGENLFQQYFSGLSFFFLLNRTFGDDISAKTREDEVVFSMESDEETEGSQGMVNQGGWADDLGGVFGDNQKLAVEDVQELEPVSKPKFSALEQLERSELESVERRRVWIRNGLLGTAVVLVALLLIAGIQIFSGPSPEEIARMEMLQEFPRFESEYQDLEVVRVPAQQNEDEGSGGTVTPRWQDEVQSVLATGGLDQARERMKELANQDLGDWKRHIALANLLLPDQSGEALEALKGFQERVPGGGPVDIALARVMTDYLSDYEAAMDILEDASPGYRNETAFLELLLRAQEGLEDRSGVVLTLRELLQLSGEDTLTNQLRLAEGYLDSGNFLRARQSFKGLLQGKDRRVNRQAFWGFIKASQGLGETKSMVEVSQSLHQRDPQSRDVMLFLAEYYLGRRQYQEVDTYLGRLDQSGVSWRTLFIRAISAFRQGSLKQSHTMLLQLQGLRPQDSNVMVNFAMVLREMEQDKASFNAFAKASEMAPEMWLPLCAMGQDYHATGDFKSALKMFERAASMKEHPWLQEILKVEMSSKKAEDLAAKPCLHTGMIESTLYDLTVASAEARPARFASEDLDRFYPTFRTAAK